jgi:hypothetical protein
LPANENTLETANGRKIKAARLCTVAVNHSFIQTSRLSKNPAHLNPTQSAANRDRDPRSPFVIVTMKNNLQTKLTRAILSSWYNQNPALKKGQSGEQTKP